MCVEFHGKGVEHGPGSYNGFGVGQRKKGLGIGLGQRAWG